MVNPATTADTSQSIKALITKVNNPKVKKLIGAVKNINAGLIKVLITPKTMAAKMAAPQSAISNPGTR